MTPDHLLRRTVDVQIVTNGAPDDYGNPGEVVAVTRTRGELQQEAREEGPPDTHTQITAWRLFLPAGTPANGWGRVDIDGDRYELIGPPWSVFNPRTGQTSHVEASLVRTV